MTEDEIVAYIGDARDFAFSNSSGLDCIFSQTPACCLSWAGTKLETDFLFGDINEVDGTIKVKLLQAASAYCTRRTDQIEQIDQINQIYQIDPNLPY